MFDSLKKYFKLTKTDKDKIDRKINSLKKRYYHRPDPWGLNLEIIHKFLYYAYPIYKKYFKVRVFGAENLKNKPFMLVGNHSGQIPWDAILLDMAFFMETKPPRILRGMAERFLPTMPFLGEFAASTGMILGDRKNCEYLMKQGESILAFPEGVRGIAKSHDDYYKLQSFTHGFFRLALSHRIDIIPVAIVGAEEFYPYTKQFPRLAKMFKLPAFPVSPTFPLLGPLGVLPLPSPIDIYFGEPYQIPKKLSPDASEIIISKHVKKIEKQINSMLDTGLKKRRPFLEKYGLSMKRDLKS